MAKRKSAGHFCPAGFAFEIGAGVLYFFHMSLYVRYLFSRLRRRQKPLLPAVSVRGAYRKQAAKSAPPRIGRAGTGKGSAADMLQTKGEYTLCKFSGRISVSGFSSNAWPTGISSSYRALQQGVFT